MSDDELLAQAANRLQSGDLQGARTGYKAVAGRGNVKGAFSLAQTYDPDFLAAHRIRGAKPDPNLARRWYEKAAKLGDREASTRANELKELQDNSSASAVLRR
jgi:TPR repeat protein